MAPAAGAAAGAVTDDVVDQLKKLGELRDAGILTDEEFAAEEGQPPRYLTLLNLSAVDH